MTRKISQSKISDKAFSNAKQALWKLSSLINFDNSSFHNHLIDNEFSSHCLVTKTIKLYWPCWLQASSSSHGALHSFRRSEITRRSSHDSDFFTLPSFPSSTVSVCIASLGSAPLTCAIDDELDDDEMTEIGGSVTLITLDPVGNWSWGTVATEVDGSTSEPALQSGNSSELSLSFVTSSSSRAACLKSCLALPERFLEAACSFGTAKNDDLMPMELLVLLLLLLSNKNLHALERLSKSKLDWR